MGENVELMPRNPLLGSDLLLDQTVSDEEQETGTDMTAVGVGIGVGVGGGLLIIGVALVLAIMFLKRRHAR